MASYTLKNVSDKLWKSVKKLAIDKGVTIQALIVDLLKEAIKK